MSDSIAVQPLPIPERSASSPMPRTGFVAAFAAVLESLVAAQAHQFKDTHPLLYRFPPL